MKKVFKIFTILFVVMLCCGCSKEEKKIDLLGIDFTKEGNEVSLEKYETDND